MSISDTEYLSKLPITSLKQVNDAWPSPAIPLAAPVILGAGAVLITQYTQQENLTQVIGSLAGLFVVIMGLMVYFLIKFSSAEKLLEQTAEEYSLPFKEAFKKFKESKAGISKELKNA